MKVRYTASITIDLDEKEEEFELFINDLMDTQVRGAIEQDTETLVKGFCQAQLLERLQEDNSYGSIKFI